MNEAVSKRSTPATITRVEPSSEDDAGGDGVMVKMQRHLHPRVRYSCHHKKEGVYVLYKLAEVKYLEVPLHSIEQLQTIIALEGVHFTFRVDVVCY